jgi:hypothetical protein
MTEQEWLACTDTWRMLESLKHFAVRAEMSRQGCTDPLQMLESLRVPDQAAPDAVMDCTDPWQKLEFLRGRASDRKRRLWGVACARRVLHTTGDEPRESNRMALEAAERYVDGDASEDGFRQTSASFDPFAWGDRYRATRAARHALWACKAVGEDCTDHLHFAANYARDAVAVWAECEAVTGAVGADPDWEAVIRTAVATAQTAEQQAQAVILRCILGNPFRPLQPLDPSWLKWNGGTIRHIAEGIYEERAFDRLPILADALEEAGCTDPDILSHLRGPGPHVRGCWPVDLILGKS